MTIDLPEPAGATSTGELTVVGPRGPVEPAPAVVEAPAPPATPEARKASRWYVPAFDGLRGLLATLVMWVHAGFPGNVLWLAVPVFFVMSGFFITKILLTRSAGKVAGVRAFVRNRALRLGPIYVLFITFITAAAITDHPASARADLPYLWTFTYDFRLITEGWNADLYKHVWSVAVEVQLCALFAVAALALSRRAFRTFLIVLVLTGPLVRIAVGLVLVRGGGLDYGYMIEVLQGLPFGYADAFAMGGLLAYPEVFRRLPSTRTMVLAVAALIAAISAVEVIVAARTGAPFPLWKAWEIAFPIDYAWIWGYTLLGILAVLLIVTVSRQVGPIPRLLDNRVLIWLGERSYSIYLLHLPVFLIGHRLVGYDPTPLQQLAVFLGCGAGAIALATVTFRFVELPFLKMKSRTATAPPAT